MRFSNGDINNYKACPRRFYYTGIEGWEQAEKPVWLTTGSAYDRLLEIYDFAGFETAKMEIPSLFSDLYERHEALFVLRQFHDLLGPDNLPPYKSQNGFGVDFPGIDDFLATPGLKLTGYMDKLSHTPDGDWVVTERKSTSEAIESNSQYWDRLPLDGQIHQYVAALALQGLRCGKVYYEVVRKPAATKQAFFNRKGTPEEYAARLEAGYDGYDGKTLVARRVVFITQQMIQEWLIDIVIYYNDVKNKVEFMESIKAKGFDPKWAWPKCEKSCKDYGGCAFFGVCSGKMPLEPGIFKKSDRWLRQQKEKNV